MTFEDACAAFNARKMGNAWMARCPAHDDGERRAGWSLSVKDHPGEEHWHPHCFAGCDANAVLAALSLDYADTFYGARARGKQEFKSSDSAFMRARKAAEAWCREEGINPNKVLTTAVIESVQNAMAVDLWPDYPPYDLNKYRLERIRKELDNDGF